MHWFPEKFKSKKMRGLVQALVFCRVSASVKMPWLLPERSLLAAWQTVVQTPAAISPQTSIRLLESNGETAKLEIRSALDAEPRPVEFVLVEKKWIPKALAESWPRALERANAQLAEVTDEQSAQIAGRITPLLLQIAGVLDQMANADRPEELQLGWWQIHEAFPERVLCQCRENRRIGVVVNYVGRKFSCHDLVRLLGVK